MQVATSGRRHPFAIRPASDKHHLYALGRGARIFASPWIDSDAALRQYAAIFLTAQGEPFTLSFEASTASHRAAVLRPMTRRAVRAHNVQILSFQLDPLHRQFARFRAIPRPGVLALDRQSFAGLDGRLRALYRGEASLTEAAALFDEVLATVLPLLPPTRDIDPRVMTVIELLHRDHDVGLERLAGAVGLSYDRLSHLFAESMGVPLRAYQSWRKLYKAFTLLSSNSTLRLTDLAHAAGFTDSSHLCRAFIAAHGAPPSYFLNNDQVTIHSVGYGGGYALARQLAGQRALPAS